MPRWPSPILSKSFQHLPHQGRTWRIAHLSDIHVVGERYGFRIESGRSGPRGNERLRRVLAQLADLDAKDPLDAILITGDMTDAGRASEWAEFLDALAPTRISPNVYWCCRAITTSMLPIVPIQPVSNCRRARTGGSASFASCRFCVPCRAGASMSWTMRTVLSAVV